MAWVDDPITTETTIKAIHVAEIRNKLDILNDDSCPLHNATFYASNDQTVQSVNNVADLISNNSTVDGLDNSTVLSSNDGVVYSSNDIFDNSAEVLSDNETFNASDLLGNFTSENATYCSSDNASYDQSINASENISDNAAYDETVDASDDSGVYSGHDSNRHNTNHPMLNIIEDDTVKDIYDYESNFNDKGIYSP